jgi:hypothetical protein
MIGGNIHAYGGNMHAYGGNHNGRRRRHPVACARADTDFAE